MIRMAWLALAAALFAGCGSGGSPNSADGHGLGPAAGPSAATLSVSTRAASAATVLYGVSFTVTLPAGVSVAADPATGEVSSGALHVNDTRALAGARLVRATATAPAAINVEIVDALGFTVGDLATINCTVQPGAEVSAAAFPISNFVALDANAAPLAVTPQLSVRTQ